MTKTITRDELVDAIGRVRSGDAVFSPRLAGFVLDAFAGDLPTPIDPELDQLTPREREVLRLIAHGYSYKEMAQPPAPLGQDRRDPRVVGAAQAPALQPPRADDLGRRPPPALNPAFSEPGPSEPDACHRICTCARRSDETDETGRR